MRLNKHVRIIIMLGPITLKTIGDSDSVTMAGAPIVMNAMAIQYLGYRYQKSKWSHADVVT